MNMKETIKKVSIFIGILIIVMLLTNIIGRYILNINPTIILSNNMFPTYEKYDSLFYSPSNNYNVNDVIVASVPNQDVLLISRIIKINEDGNFDAKGDNNTESFTPIERNINKNQILGKVVSSMKSYFYFPLIYGIQIVIALFLANYIYRKVKAGKIKNSRVLFAFLILLGIIISFNIIFPPSNVTQRNRQEQNFQQLQYAKNCTAAELSATQVKYDCNSKRISITLKNTGNMDLNTEKYMNIILKNGTVKTVDTSSILIKASETKTYFIDFDNLSNIEELQFYTKEECVTSAPNIGAYRIETINC